MGDTVAPASAEPEPSSRKPGGFLGRLFDIISPEEAQSDAQVTAGQAPASLPHLGLLSLRRMRVEDVSIPKADIVAVPVTTSQEELIAAFRESGLTRLPVYDGTLDTPIGLANLKDMALKFGFNGGSESYDLAALVRPLLFVPPSMSLAALLQKMQAERIHMALVIDEYGGTDGLLTIEDLIEQVVGEIEDEHDIDDDQLWVREKPGVYSVLAKTPLDEFEAEIGIDLTASEEIDEEEVDTLGGLVFMLCGHVPSRGEVVLHPAGLEIEVLDADPRRIKRLRVRVDEPDRG